MDDKSILKGAWSGHINHWNISEHQPYFWNGFSYYNGQILYTVYAKSQHTDNKWPLKGRGRDPL